MEQLLYTPPSPFSNPVRLFSHFFQKILLKSETVRVYSVVLPLPGWSEQIAVGTGAEQRQHKNAFVNIINKKQIGGGHDTREARHIGLTAHSHGTPGAV